MPTSEILMSDFKNKYGLEQSFDELQASVSGRAAKIRVSEELLAEGSSKSPQAQQYLTGLLHIFEKVVEKKIAPTQNGSEYTISLPDIIRFIRDYEGIMAAKHAETQPNKFRNPHEGLAVEVLNRLADNMRAYNQPLPELWAKRIRNHNFKVEDLSAITDNIHNKAQSSLRIENNYNGIVTIFLAESAKPSVETAIIIHDALEKAIARRTIFTYLWAGNWGRISRENAYMEKLQAQLQDYNRWNENILSDTRSKYAEPTISVHQEIIEHRNQIVEEHKKKVKAKKSAAEKDKTLKAKTQPKNSKQKVESFEASFDKFNKLLLDDSTTTAIQNDIHKLLHASKMPSNFLKYQAPAIYNSAIEQIRGIWSSIRGESDEVKEHQVKIGVISLIDNIYNALSSHNMDTTDRLVATQKIADLMLNKYSPIAFNSDYKEYGDKYFINNATPEQIKDLTNYEGELDNFIEDLKSEINRIPLIENPDNNKAQNKEQEIKNNAKSVKKADNSISAESVEQRFNDSIIANTVKEQINNMLTESPIPFSTRRYQIPAIHSQITQTIQNIWQNINDQPDADKNAIMSQGAKDTFETAYNALEVSRMQSKDRLVAAQRITDLMMNQYSPAAFNTDYAKYSDNYFMKNATDKEIQDLTSFNVINDEYDNLNEFINAAKLDLGIGKVHVNINDSIDNDVKEVSARVDDYKAPENDKVINH